MSKLLRWPLVLLVALAMALVWSAPASADPPTAEDCVATPTLEGCPQPDDPALLDGDSASDPTSGDGGTDDDGTGDSGVGDAGAGPGDTGTGDADSDGTDSDEGESVPAFRGYGTGGTGGAEGAEGTDDPSALVEEVPPLLPEPAPICAEFPQFPGCPDAPPAPGEPLTCDQLAELLALPECPESFTCEDLAQLFGLDGCPEGGEPPTCEDLAALFGLEGCPDGPPASCEEFAALFGVEDCEQIPCLDTSQLPDEAREGLAPLLEGLEQIGIEACPPQPVTGGGNDGGGSPPPGEQPEQQPVHYENCDDARAKGKAPVHSTDAGYRSDLDSDHDGIGCEETVTYAAPVQSAGTLAYTGIDLELWLRAGAILLSSGTLLLLAGRRRA
jgi:hypothetical protein